MTYVAHFAALNRRASDGSSTERAHVEDKARRGDEAAMRELIGPRFPDALTYLHDWFGELHHARGESMNGLASLSYANIDAWARLTDRHPQPHEVSALFELDSAYRTALEGSDDVKPVVTEAPTTPAWPQKKRLPDTQADG